MKINSLILRHLNSRRIYICNFVLIGTALLIFTIMASIAQAQVSLPQTQAPQTMTPPYDKQLSRISEIIGTITYLRNRCAEQPEPQWRAAMEKLLTVEAGNEPARKEQLTAAYNRGYRAFSALHTSCTAAALATEQQYRAEGATLIREMTNRFGN